MPSKNVLKEIQEGLDEKLVQERTRQVLKRHHTPIQESRGHIIKDLPNESLFFTDTLGEAQSKK